MSPYILAMSMGVLACGIKYLSPWYMLFADDIVLCSTRSDEVEKKLRRGRGLNISRKKTVYKRFNVGAYIGTWVGTQISIYMEIIIWKE